MYKLFAFLFFTSITIVIIYMFSGKNLPIGPFMVVNIILYLGFVLYVGISSFFKAKYSFSEIGFVKKLRHKLEKYGFLAKFICHTAGLIYILLVIFCVILLFFLFMYPLFMDTISEHLSYKPSALSPTNFSQVEKKISDAATSLFYMNNQKEYTSSDEDYDFIFRILEVAPNESSYDVSYHLLFCGKNWPGNYCLNTSEDKLRITGKINSFSAESVYLKDVGQRDIFLIKVTDNEKNSYKIYYLGYPEDSSDVYRSLDVSDVLGSFTEDIISVTPDTENSLFNIEYTYPNHETEKAIIKFSKDEEGYVKYEVNFLDPYH